jgi:hypothetical protein
VLLLHRMDLLSLDQSNNASVEKTNDPLHCLPFVSGTSFSRLTRALNVLPRKLSGVLRAADNADGNGLALFGDELLPLASLGYKRLPPNTAPLFIGGEIDPVLAVGRKLGIVDDGISQGFDDVGWCGCCW